jgi:hypothetical protein
VVVAFLVGLLETFQDVLPLVSLLWGEQCRYGLKLA